MEEVMLKTHLIITDIDDEYIVKWCGKIANTKPLFKNNMPIFVIISSTSRVEMNTIDMKRIEECAKKLTHPRGRKAFTSDVARIYIKEEDGNEKIMGRVIHNHIKHYKPVYDRFYKI